MNLEVKALIRRYIEKYTEFDDVKFDHLDCPGHGEDRLIHFAARYGPLSGIQILVSNGSDLPLKGDMGKSTLHWAAASGHLDVVQYLLSHGADRSVADVFGDTPSKWAGRNGHTDISALLG